MRKLGFGALLALLLVGLPLTGTTGTVWAQLKHNCDFCHNLHGGSYNQLRDWDVSEDLCLSCHGDGGPATWNRDGVDVPIPKGVDIHNGSKHLAPTSCWDCHDHEGEAGSNWYMVPEQMPTPNSGTLPVVFTDTIGPNSFADGDTNYDGVCEVCHTGTDQHRNDGSVSQHNALLNCTDCHSHDGGFAGAGACTICHKNSQAGRRPIVAEFDRTSHHVDWTLLPNGLAPDSMPESDCQACHDQSRHQLGNVRLWNVDSPGDTTQSVALTGDPFSDQTEADKLAAFCLACHDADAAAGSAPFSDGIAPPVVVTAGAWSGVSHNAPGTVSCFGCHGSGHGSEKTKLLMPDVGAVSTPDSANVQEGFCFQCHDSDGPASVDIATAFNAVINWVQTATGLNANANLNDRHDVQYSAQNRSGAKIECTSCHNPHTATSAQPYILDPDTGDGHVPGTDYYYYSSTSDVLSEFCLDCHDGSFPSGVQDQTTSITNIQSTWSADAMGARTGASVDLRSGTGYAIGDIMPCWACHSVHARIDADIGVGTLFSVVDTLRNKAGDTYLYYQGRKGSDPQIYAYAITDNVDKNDVTSGAYWCNSCHKRYSMTGKENCYGCHRHGDGGRF
jgi:predicted CXXCH cytochrome family protein